MKQRGWVPRRGGFALVPFACAVLAIALFGASPASAVESDMYDVFTDCPTDHPLMNDPDFGYAGVGCVASITNGGSFTMGNRTTEVEEPSKVQFGNGSLQDDAPCEACLPVVTPPDGRGLQSSPSKVPGGLLGLEPLPVSEDPQPGLLAGLENQLNQTVNQLLEDEPPLAVRAQVRLAGEISRFNLGAALGSDEPVFRLPIKVQLQNELLGNQCYIGSDENPIVLNPSYTEHPTEQEFLADPNGFAVSVIASTGGSLADDQFAVPGASGCGPAGLLDSVINNQVGLPSPAGNNEATFLDSESYLAIGESGEQLQAAFDAAQQP